jgi:hemerythrin-like domain-containing protein
MYSKPMQILVDEHEVILSVLDALEHVARDAGRKFDRGFYEDAVEFFATFADKCHHAKEEDMLFPALEAAGMPRERGPIGVMLSDHVEGRGHVGAIREAIPQADAGDAAAYQLIRREALAYAEMLRAHIQKENLVLFVMGDRILGEDAKASLEKQFQCEHHSPLPKGTHQRYLDLASSLRERARSPREVCMHCA